MDNVVFIEREYDTQLGCYIKWLHGNPNQVINKMYSVSAFHFFTSFTGYITHDIYYKYAEYLEQFTLSIINNSPDWFVRIYVDESIFTLKNKENIVWRKKLTNIMHERVQLICIKMPRYYIPESENHQGLLPVIFRYLPLFDPNVNICLFRDIDNIWTDQHQYFIDRWLSGDEDICLFLNKDYKRQQMKDLTKEDIILEEKYYTTILSGLWSIRKAEGYTFPIEMWYKIFAYLESYTDFVNDNKYIGYKFHKIRFTYGFDELSLTRILMPMFINMSLTFYAIPLKIYDVNYLNNLFEEPALNKFFKVLTYKGNIDIIKNIIIKDYWQMKTENAGLSQYMLCLLTNIYFNLITKKSKYYKNEIFLNILKTKVYPAPLLMSIGLFTFKNYKKYNWYPLNHIDTYSGSNIMETFLSTNKKITLDEFTANSKSSNEEKEDQVNPYHI